MFNCHVWPGCAWQSFLLKQTSLQLHPLTINGMTVIIEWENKSSCRLYSDKPWNTRTIQGQHLLSQQHTYYITFLNAL